jgi:hypothetical protein
MKRAAIKEMGARIRPIGAFIDKKGVSVHGTRAGIGDAKAVFVRMARRAKGGGSRARKRVRAR